MVAGFDRKNRMPLLLETKQDKNGKCTVFVESVCCMVPIACNLIDSAYGLKNLVNMQILTFHHTVWTQNCASDCNVEVKVVIFVHKKLQILWKLGGPQSCKL